MLFFFFFAIPPSFMPIKTDVPLGGVIPFFSSPKEIERKVGSSPHHKRKSFLLFYEGISLGCPSTSFAPFFFYFIIIKIKG